MMGLQLDFNRTSCLLMKRNEFQFIVTQFSISKIFRMTYQENFEVEVVEKL